jgi:hypothetical protein
MTDLDIERDTSRSRSMLFFDTAGIILQFVAGYQH